MAKISFRYGAMGSSKTAQALMIKYNFEEKGKKAILLKPKLEHRDGKTKIKSRIGLESHCMFVEDYLKNVKTCDCIIVDEAQFMTSKQVDELAYIADMLDIKVGSIYNFLNGAFNLSQKKAKYLDSWLSDKGFQKGITEK